jgi:predicted ATPase
MISNKIIAKEFFMELVYLWVKNYKNIVEQGFNFSPRFRCEYDEDMKELEIIDKEKTGEFYPKNFFGDNINVTAIVGENGSGKSSILEELCSSFGMKLSVILENNEIKIYTHITDIKIKNLTTKSYMIIDERLSQVYFSWDILQYEAVIDYYSYCKVNPNILFGILGTFSHPDYIDLNSYQNNTVLKYIEIYIKDKINIFDFSPTKINIKFPMKKNEDEWNLEKIKEEIEKLEFPKEEEKRKKKIYFETIKKYIGNYLKDGNFERNFTIEEYIKMIKELYEFREILSRFPSFILDIYDNEISFFSLSHGERSILLSNALIYESIINEKNQNILICLDEPELSLHPEWQKKYVNELIKMFSKVDKNLHFIITSHSPFILSDLPKENIIFLEKGKQVYPFDDGKQTFGANIHTLLSHGFFMKDGLMGEFAKDKIQSIIKYHEDIEKKEISEADKIEYKTKKQKEFWQIQSIIGDDYLKQVIKNHLIEIEKIVLGNDEAKKEEVKRLKAQIELLEK